MEKDFLKASQPFLTDEDFDLQNKNLTFQRSISHKNRNLKNQDFSKKIENQRKNEIS